MVGYRSNLTIVRSTLTIHRVALADSGNISCVAEIPLARLLSSTNFIVHCKIFMIVLKKKLTYGINSF